MADGRKNNGARKGENRGQGRKPKTHEQNLIEKLTPIEPEAFKALSRALTNGEGWAVKLFMEYKYGKPSQTINQNNRHAFDEDFDITKVFKFGD